MPCPHPARAWLEATHASRYPFAVVRVHRLLSSPRSGDLVVTAAEGHDFGRDYELIVDNNRGGHGGLRAAQLLVSYALAGPGVPKGRRIETASSEDVGAVLLELLNVPSGPGTGADLLAGRCSGPACDP